MGDVKSPIVGDDKLGECVTLRVEADDERITVYDWMDEQYDPRDDYAPCATEAEAHAEWHLNTGLKYGCPWDACDPPEHDDDEPTDAEIAELERTGAFDPATGEVVYLDFLVLPAHSDDDIPF